MGELTMLICSKYDGPRNAASAVKCLPLFMTHLKEFNNV